MGYDSYQVFNEFLLRLLKFFSIYGFYPATVRAEKGF